MYQMFYYCENLTNLDLSYFETLNVLDMSDMFSYCSNLSILNLSSFKLNNKVNIKDIVFSCDSLKKVKVNKEMLTKFSKEIRKNLLEC
jgi:surface protein